MTLIGKKTIDTYIVSHTGKTTVKFPLDKPLPKALITKLAKYRVKELKENDARWM